MINEIIIITKELSLKNNFDIIFNEDQYFLASDNIDVSNQIIELLNKKKLDLKITEITMTVKKFLYSELKEFLKSKLINIESTISDNSFF